MSSITQQQHDDYIERCIRLSQLIKQRKAQQVVSEEIKELLAQGVNINHQDLNRRSNTYLHLAISNNDVKCVEFLLKFKPRLDIRNVSNESPVEMASRMNCREISMILRRASSSTDSIDQNFIHEFNFADISAMKIEAISINSSFKVLKIVDCPSVDELLSVFIASNFADIFRQTSNFFFIDVSVWDEIDGLTDDHCRDINIIFPESRPLIIEITPCGTDTMIYYKEENSTGIQKVQRQSLSEDEIFQKAISSDECNLSLLLEALQSNIYGEHHENLLEIKLHKNEERNRLTNLFAKNALSLRFLKIFEESLDDRHWTGRAYAVMNCNDVSCLLAFLDHQFVIEERELRLSHDLREQMFRTDSRLYNLLMIAVETNNAEAVKYLVRCGFNLNHLGTDKKTAVDLAWNFKFYKCLAAIIEADSHFPQKFDINSIPLGEERTAITETLNEKNNLLTHVSKGNLEDVKEIIMSKTRVNSCYTSSNKSALTVALEFGQFDVYAYLKSEGFSAENDNYYDHFYSRSDKGKIREANKKFFYELKEPHLSILLAKSRLTFGSKDRADSFQIIRKIYTKLNEIEEVSANLKLIASSETLQIVFDFNLDNVLNMDPSKTCHTRGTSYHKSGYIYIGVKKHETDLNEILGTLAHEMCHYAMYLIYENDCLPYLQSDEENREAFKKAYDETQKCFLSNPYITEPMIRYVFTNYENILPVESKDPVKLAELIVRVPHVLIQYKDDDKKISELKRDFCELFSYYSKKVYIDVKKQCELNAEKDAIKEINCLTVLLPSIRNNGISLKSLKTIKAAKDNRVKILSTNTSTLTLTSIYQTYINEVKGNVESCHIFLNVDSLSDPEIVKKIRASLKSSALPNVFIDCCNKVNRFESDLINFFKDANDKQRSTLIMSRKESLILRRKFSSNNISSEVLHLRHSWRDLDDNVQEEWIKTLVNFQGITMKCSELLESTSDVFKDFPLNDFLNGKTIKIGKALIDPSRKFFIGRNFVKSQERSENFQNNHEATSESNIFGFQNMIDNGISEKIVLISGEAGTGKTSALFELASVLKKANPSSWVSFVDLKQFVKSFENYRKSNVAESFDNFFIETILKKEKIFDRKLFKQLFTSGRAIILLDGFDEISPSFKDLILQAVVSFEVDSTNQLWITTRSHLEVDLEKALKCQPFHLLPLTESEQIDFLVKTWELSDGTITSPSELNFKAKILIEKLSLSSDLKFIGLPMLVNMLAKVYADKSLEPNMNLDINFIFDQFFEVTIDNWMSKGEQYRIEQKRINMQVTGVMEIHYKLALQYVLNRSPMELSYINYDRVEWSDERISRVGIVLFDSATGVSQFSHVTFAEYLVARFVFNGLTNCDETLSRTFLLFFKFTAEKSFKIIRSFLDNFLKNFQPDERIRKLLARTLNETLQSGDFDSLLSFAAGEPQHDLVNFIIGTSDDETLRRILLYQEGFPDSDPNDMGYMPYHLAALKNDNKMITLLFTASLRLLPSDCKEIFLRKGFDDQSILQCAASSFWNETAFPTVWNQINGHGLLSENEKKDLLKHKDDTKSNIFHNVACEGSKNLLQIVFKTVRDTLNSDDVVELLMGKNHRGDLPIHNAVLLNFEYNVEVFLNEIKQVFMSEAGVLKLKDIQKLFSKNGSEGKSLFHLAIFNDNSGVLTKLWNWFSHEKLFSVKEMKSMFHQVDNDQFNILQSTISTENLKAMSEFFLIVKNFDYSERKKTLVDTIQHGLNSLQMTVSYNSLPFLGCLLENLGDLLEIKDEKLLFDSRGPESETIFHFAACNKFHPNIFSLLSKYVISKSIFIADEIKELLIEKDEHLNNILHVIAKKNNYTAFDSLIEVLGLYLKPSEFKNFLFELDDEGRTSLLLAATFGSKKLLDSFFLVIKRFVKDQKDIVDLFNHSDFDDTNIFHAAAFSKESDIFPVILSHVSATLNDNAVKKLIQEKDIDSSNPLQLLLEKQSNDSNIFFFCNRIMKKILTPAEIKAVLQSEDVTENTVLHYAIGLANKQVVKILFDFIKSSLEPEEQKSLVQFNGYSGMNIFHCAADNSEVGIFESLRDYLNGILNSSEIKAMLCQSDIYGRSLLIQLAAVDADQEEFKEVFSFLQTYLSFGEMRELITKADATKMNILQTAAVASKTLSFFVFLFIILDEYFTFTDTSEILRTLLMNKDADNKNAFQLACFYNNELVREWLWKIIMENCDFHEQEEMLVSLGFEAADVMLELIDSIDDQDQASRFMKIINSMFENNEPFIYYTTLFPGICPPPRPSPLDVT